MESSNNNTSIQCQEFPPFPVCSGNGVCDTAKGICICNEGWSSIGDFASKDGVDCNINIAAVKVLPIIMMVLGIIVLVLASLHIARQIYYYRMKERKMKGYLSDAARTYPIWILIMGTLCIVSGAYSHVHPLRVIGRDITITIVSYMLAVVYAFVVTDFLIIVFRFFYHYTLLMPDAATIRMRREVSMALSSSYIFKLSAVLINLIPSFCTLFPDNDFEIGAVYHGLLSTWNIVVVVYLLIRGIHVMIELLEEHTKNIDISMGSMDNKLQMLLLRLKRVRFIFVSNIIGPTTIWYIVAFSRTFSRQSIYFYYYIIVSALIASIAALAAIPPQKPKKIKEVTSARIILDNKNANNNPNINLSKPQSSYGDESIPHQNSKNVVPAVI